MSKIPSDCRSCRSSLSRTAMEAYLDRCAKRGVDPVAHALALDPPGILCIDCQARALVEALSPDIDETPAEQASADLSAALRGEP